MRLCKKCKKPGVFKTYNGRTYYHCYECQKKYNRGHYKKNKSQYLARNRRRRQEVIEKVFDYLKTHPCVDCGEKDFVVLDFDHVKGKKKKNVSQLIGCSTWPMVWREIKKCEVRCANCHRRKTFGKCKKFGSIVQKERT